MRSGVLILSALLAPVCLSGSAVAQDGPQRGPDAGTRTYVPGIDVLPIPGLPFSGTDKITWVRPIEGGGSLTSYLEAKVLRDSQGRIYRESHRFGSKDADPGKTLYAFQILDPVTQTATVCEVATHLCHVVKFRPRLSVAVQAPGSFDNGRQFLTREVLGNQQMLGLAVFGTREVVSIQPGTVANDIPLTLQREFWYSPDMKMNVAVTRKDPRTGTQSVELTKFSRSEPDPTLLRPPAEYRILPPVVAAVPLGRAPQPQAVP